VNTALVEALAQEIFEVIDNYGERMPVAVAVGVLEAVKYQLMRQSAEEEE
jgi:predicted outer membrane lipoprotein